MAADRGRTLAFDERRNGPLMVNLSGPSELKVKSIMCRCI